MATCSAPTAADLERFKVELEDIQKGDLAQAMCLWFARSLRVTV